MLPGKPFPAARVVMLGRLRGELYSLYGYAPYQTFRRRQGTRNPSIISRVRYRYRSFPYNLLVPLQVLLCLGFLEIIGVAMDKSPGEAWHERHRRDACGEIVSDLLRPWMYST